MKDFNKLDPRLITKNNSDQLVFNIFIPENLGNEFQGLECKVEFKFYVEETMGGILPVDGPRLPNTGTSMYNILVIGSIFLITGLFLQFILLIRRRYTKQV